jgi:hypothetical protein
MPVRQAAVRWSAVGGSAIAVIVAPLILPGAALADGMAPLGPISLAEDPAALVAAAVIAVVSAALGLWGLRRMSEVSKAIEPGPVPPPDSLEDGRAS